MGRGVSVPPLHPHCIPARRSISDPCSWSVGWGRGRKGQGRPSVAQLWELASCSWAWGAQRLFSVAAFMGSWGRDPGFLPRPRGTGVHSCLCCRCSVSQGARCAGPGAESRLHCHTPLPLNSCCHLDASRPWLWPTFAGGWEWV